MSNFLSAKLKSDFFSVAEILKLNGFAVDKSLSVVYQTSFLKQLLCDNKKDSFLLDDPALKIFKDFFESGKSFSSASICIKINNSPMIFNGTLLSLDRDGDEVIFCVLHDNMEITMEKKMRKLKACCIFSGGAVHDFNNALTAVMGNISLAKLDGSGNRDLLELLKEAEKGSLRIREITEKISLFSRAEKIEKETCSVKEIIVVLLSLFNMKYGYEIKVDIHEDYNISGDREMLIEALFEIIENAFEATSNENRDIALSVVKIDINKENPFCSTIAEGDYVQISIVDNGIGFDKNDTDKLCEPFYTTKENRDGFGLAFAYAVLKRHRGYIVPQQGKSGGSVFNVFIPLF